jgi:hypothetical protein
MKKIIITVILMSTFAITGFAQTKVEQYCTVNVNGRSDKFTAVINYGNNSAYTPAEQKLKNNFKSVAEVLNFLGADGWKLADSRMPYDGTNYYMFIFKKDVDKQLITSTASIK